MIDIHSHLIYDVDDGSKTIEESISILDNYSKNGITDIILTPHYIADSRYISDRENNYERFVNLKKEILNRNIDINIYLGNEIYIDPNIKELILDKKISTMNASHYILVELPMNGIYDGYTEIFEKLIRLGFKVILAHPERYNSFQKDYSLITELYDLGVRFQCNLGSFIGEYGKEAKKTIKMMSKEKLISYIGTDIHHEKDYTFIDKGIKLMAKYYTSEELDDILINNPKNILKK